jgi:GNAT superfamily N-acetyltransferase
MIRPSIRADIKVLAEFQVRLADETENVHLHTEIVSAGMKALFDDPSKGTYYVAISHEKIVGCFLITYEWSDWRNGMVWWLQSVYVEKTHRQQGVFKHMYDHIKQLILNDPGIIGLRLYVDKSNSRAQKVYASIGMNGDHYTVFEWMKP